MTSRIDEPPKVPDPLREDGTSVVTYNEDTDTVAMPLWYWKKLVRYIIDTQDIGNKDAGNP